MTHQEANPSFDCIDGKHMFFDIFDKDNAPADTDDTGGGHDRDDERIIGGWCMWCGTAAYDADRISDDGTGIGFTPTFRARIPDGFHRQTAN